MESILARMESILVQNGIPFPNLTCIFKGYMKLSTHHRFITQVR